MYMTNRKSSNPPAPSNPAVAVALQALVQAGALQREPDGRYTIPPAAPNPDELVTLVCRVPRSWVDTLDAMGPNRSEAARKMLGKAMSASSGTRRAVRDTGT